MLPMEVVDRTFRIATNESEGTAFAFDFQGRQYLVTAKHVVKEIEAKGTIEIFHDDQWKPLPVRLVGHSESDVSVLAATELLARPEMVLESSIGGWFVGQDAYFVGFPLGFAGEPIHSSFPSPLLRKAIISGKLRSGYMEPFVLDAVSNPGFSGSPVYLKTGGDERYKVAMIIASYAASQEAVYDAQGSETGLTWQNSGLTYAYSIKVAIDLIESNPIGFEIVSQG
jgi:S1-C subfamily serine protease